MCRKVKLAIKTLRKLSVFCVQDTHRDSALLNKHFRKLGEEGCGLGFSLPGGPSALYRKRIPMGGRWINFAVIYGVVGGRRINNAVFS